MLNCKLSEHFVNPRNIGIIDEPSYVVLVGDPSCGDKSEIFLQVKGSQIIDIKYKAYGCSASIATASIISEYVKGKNIEDIKELDDKLTIELLGELEPNQSHCINYAKNFVSLCSNPAQYDIKGIERKYLIETSEYYE